jgi:hypothetical protein
VVQAEEALEDGPCDGTKAPLRNKVASAVQKTRRSLGRLFRRGRGADS